MAEWDAARLSKAVSASTDLRAEVLERYADTAPAQMNDHANAALAQAALIEAARAEQGELRDFYLARADDVIMHLRKVRPDWAPTRLLAVQARLGRYGNADSRALQDFAASYRAEPFMMNSAQWRIAFGAAYWADLPEETRQAMVTEAVWFARADGTRLPALRAILGDSPAGMRFAMQFRP